MNKNRERGKIDWMITLLPLTIIIALCILFFFAPEQSNAVLSQIRSTGTLFWVNPTKSLSIPSLHGAP